MRRGISCLLVSCLIPLAFLAKNCPRRVLSEQNLWNVFFHDYFHDKPQNWVKLGQYTFQGHPYFIQIKNTIDEICIWGTCHRVVVYFPSQPETEYPATQSIGNILVAMITTKTSGTFVPTNSFATIHYDPMTRTPSIVFF